MTPPIDIDKGFPRRETREWGRKEIDNAVGQVFELAKISPTNATIEATRNLHTLGAKLESLGRELEQAMARVDDLERENERLMFQLYGDVER